MKSVKIMMAIVSVALIAGCGQVDTGEAGFFTRWGEVTSRAPLSEGLHFYEPWGTDLITYNIKNQTIKVMTDAFTKDVQGMKIILSATYNLVKDKVIDLHTSTGRHYVKILIEPSILAATKDAIGKMEADAIVGNREIAAQGILKALQAKLAPYGINVTLINIENIDYSDAFEKAVEEKQVALQKSMKEKNETARLREVAQQNIIKAEAEAKAMLAKADADAQAKLKISEAEAKAIDMKNKALSQSKALIEYEMVKSWDGKLPVQMLGNAPVPFLNISAEAK